MASAKPLESVRVLVVDDDFDALEMVAFVLRDAGAIIETASSAAEGLSALRTFRPHVLVSDLGMPGQDGFSFMRQVRSLSSAEGGAVPALALSAHVQPKEVALASSAGYSLHLGKPVDIDALRATVESLAASCGAI